jgi:uncharacterized membrane protein YqjE
VSAALHEQRDPTQPLEADRSHGELFGKLSSDVSGMFEAHVELAKLELREEVRSTGRAAGMFAGAGLAAFLGILLLSFAAAWGLAAVMPTGFAFLMVGLVWAVVAAVLALAGRERARHIGPPDNTIEAVKEDVEWARRQRS